MTKWINEKGTGLFHICFEVEDIESALAELKQKGVKLRDETPRIGHGGADRLHRPVRHRQCPDRAGGAAGRPRHARLSARQS